MMSMLTHIFVRRYAHHHALLIVFLSSAIWGVLWVPMRYAESFGISGLWVVTLFHLLPVIAILPFIARAYIADRRHRLVSLIAGGLMGIGFAIRSWPCGRISHQNHGVILSHPGMGDVICLCGAV